MWLREQLDEDERVARAASGDVDPLTGGRWHQPDPDRCPGRIEDANGAVVVYDEGSPTSAEAEHIARHDPAWALAEVEVKRAILDVHNLNYEGSRECYSCSDKRGDDIEPYPCPTVRLLALPYADRPGYRDEWRL
jgi:hypothetical protein